MPKQASVLDVAHVAPTDAGFKCQSFLRDDFLHAQCPEGGAYSVFVKLSCTPSQVSEL